MNKKATSQLCAIYSFTGILFMGWVGLMITYQPFFVSGLEDVDNCRTSAFGAMATFIVTFVSSILYLGYDACCLFKYGALATSDDGVDSAGPGMPRGMSDYEVNLEMADMVAAQTGAPRIRMPSTGGGRNRRPYSDAPQGTTAAGGGGGAGGGYSDTPPATSTHSAPPGRQPPTVMVAGMPRSSSVVSVTSASTPVGNLLGPGFGDDSDGSSGSSGEDESDEEGEWAASSPARAPAPGSGGGGPAMDLLS
mmetsp:Transcript_7432/g.14820  ORF Transcript_7432/g.14820 Transcript_7432/m.14820 type:complete len:250 (+) Transcript_7432:74-823(+)